MNPKTLLASTLLLLSLSAQADPARWINCFFNQSTTNEWTCFRKNFNLSKAPAHATARIAVDSKYWLWINEKLVVFEGGVKRGPNPHDIYYDEIDIAPYLIQGKNNISVLVWYFGKQGFSYNPSGKTGLFFDARGDDGFSLVTDLSWRSLVHPSYYIGWEYIPNYRLPESNIGYDARRDPGEWTKIGYREEGWKNVRLGGEEGAEPWGAFHHRIIPMWKDYGLKEYPSTEIIPGDGVDTILCHLPYNMQFTPWLKIDAPAGTKVIMRTDNLFGNYFVSLYAEYITKEGVQEYESLGWLNGHRMMYIVPKGVRLLAMKYRETGYDTEFAGTFACSDPVLNKYWQKAVRTLYITMRDTYMDCPDRERAQWWGDEVIEMGEAFYALCPKSHLLAKKGMYELMGWQREDGTIYSPVPSSNYSLELPGQMLASVGYCGFWSYYLNTGDSKPIADLYDRVKRYLAVWEIGPDGCVVYRKGGNPWGDWGTNIDREALYNAWYYLALRGVQKMAGMLGRESDAREYAQAMVSFKKAFHAKFWDGKQYRTPSCTEDTDDRVHALAVVTGLTDKALYPAVLKVLKEKEYASTYMEKYVTEALFIMHEGQYGLERMKRRYKFMLDHPFTTLFEAWELGGQVGSGGGTVNHAWSGGGLTVMSQYMCGVAPIEPGYKRFAVLPQPAGVADASMSMLSVAGTIATSYKIAGKRFTLTAEVPAGSEAVLGIPREFASGRISLNGQTVWNRGVYAKVSGVKPEADDSEWVKFAVPAGKYSLQAGY